jgi:hypothetical protein
LIGGDHGAVNQHGDTRRGPLARDPALDAWRHPPSDRCWWCGDKATTEEHRFKHSTLRRIATKDGTIDPRNLFKKADDYEGLLRSISKGSQVRWRKNLCAPCNNTRSQPFDSAYDRFEAFVMQYADDLGRWHRLDWTTVYGEEWEEGARDLARYFAKQFGCMLAGQDLDVPQDVVDFVNGADRCPSVAFMIYLNWRGIDGHRMMRRHGWDEGLTSFIGLLGSHAWANGELLTRIDYGYHIGYVWILLDWTRDSDRSSWFEHPSIELPRLNARVRDRLGWLPHRVAGELRHIWHALKKSEDEDG